MVNTLKDGVKPLLTFGKIILEAGFNPNDFPVLSKTPVILCDRKKKLLEENDLAFHGTLFAKNKTSKMKFKNLLDQIRERNFSNEPITGKLEDSALILFIPGYELAKFFFLL